MGWHNRIAEMRAGGYGTLVSLLRANTRGINPLKMDCWGSPKEEVPSTEPTFINATPETYSPHKPKSLVQQIREKEKEKEKDKAKVDSLKEREILLGAQSPAAMNGLLALKAWQKRYSEQLKQGEDMFAKDLYRLAMMRPIAGLWRVFEMA